jgi:hypothetical protein
MSHEGGDSLSLPLLCSIGTISLTCREPPHPPTPVRSGVHGDSLQSMSTIHR